MPQTVSAPLRWAQAVSLAIEAAALLDDPAPSCPDVARRGLRELLAVIEALPLCAGLVCYFRNRLASCQVLHAAGERGAVGYQMRELLRRLRRLEAAWYAA